MDELTNFIIQAASIFAFVDYTCRFIKWFLQWLQPEQKKSSKKRKRRKN